MQQKQVLIKKQYSYDTSCTNVTLRQKPLRNDRISLYLDYYPAIRNPYTMKMSRREFLGIYIYAKPKNEQQRMFNQDMLNKAEAIRCIRVQSLINEEFGFLDKFLGIYIYAKPKNEQQRMFNQDMLNKAEAIRCIRVQSLINEEFGFLDKYKQKVDFLAYQSGYAEQGRGNPLYPCPVAYQ